MNTAALLLQQRGPRGRAPAALRRSTCRGLRVWLGATALLAALFVAGQFQAWRILRALGFFLSSNPHSSFFYMLSGVHLAPPRGRARLVRARPVPPARRRATRRPRAGGRCRSSRPTGTSSGLLWVYVLFLIFVF